MKARVKATGEIVEVIRRIIQGRDFLEYVWYHREDDRYFKEYELEFAINDIPNQPDYWEKLKHQYAGMFTKSFLDNCDTSVDVEQIIDDAINMATSLVIKLKLKEESQCKE